MHKAAFDGKMELADLVKSKGQSLHYVDLCTDNSHPLKSILRRVFPVHCGGCAEEVGSPVTISQKSLSNFHCSTLLTSRLCHLARNIGWIH